MAIELEIVMRIVMRIVMLMMEDHPAALYIFSLPDSMLDAVLFVSFFTSTISPSCSEHDTLYAP